MTPPAAADPLPRRIEVVRRRRRTIELSLEGGELVARVPHRLSRTSLDEALPELRRRLWNILRRKAVFDDRSLEQRAHHVANTLLADRTLPPYSVCFSRRQQRRWGSCTVDASGGRIRISARLMGHPSWVLDHLLLHELIHLLVPHHGPAFQRLMERSPQRDRARGYLEALERMDQLGSLQHELAVTVELEAPAPTSSGELPLFPTDGPADEPGSSR